MDLLKFLKVNIVNPSLLDNVRELYEGDLGWQRTRDGHTLEQASKKLADEFGFKIYVKSICDFTVTYAFPNDSTTLKDSSGPLNLFTASACKSDALLAILALIFDHNCDVFLTSFEESRYLPSKTVDDLRKQIHRELPIVRHSHAKALGLIPHDMNNGALRFCRDHERPFNNKLVRMIIKVDRNRRLIERALGGQHLVERALKTQRLVERALGGQHLVERALKTQRLVERALGGQHLVERALKTQRLVERALGGQHLIKIMEQQNQIFMRISQIQNTCTMFQKRIPKPGRSLLESTSDVGNLLAHDGNWPC